MLGSHNSCTYLPCRKWWMYLINWAAKCQSKTLSQQFHAGVRYFDIRLKWNEKRRSWVLAHGIVEYKGNVDRVLETLDSLAKFYGEKIYVRFLLEYNKMPDNDAFKILNLVSYVGYARENYPNLTYHLVETKWDEKAVKDYCQSVWVKHKYSSVLGWKRFLWIPYWYAKLHNRAFMVAYADTVENKKNEVLMLDFV